MVLRLDAAFSKADDATAAVNSHYGNSAGCSVEQIFTPLEIRKAGESNQPGFRTPVNIGNDSGLFGPNGNVGPTNYELNPYFPKGVVSSSDDGTIFFSNCDYNAVVMDPADDISLAKNTLEKSIMTLNKQSYLKGFCTVSGSDKGTQMGELQNIDFDNGCEDALRELLVYLQAQNIEKVLFVRFPHQRKFENPEAIDKIGSIISEYGYDILNLNDKSKELGIDVTADYSDAEHLNINGMEKMTEYLGKYIINKYDVSSEKSTGDIVKWNKCVKKTKEMASQSGRRRR